MSKLTFTQLMNNIESMEGKIARKVEACRLLARHHCFEEAELIAIDTQIEANHLREVFHNFDFSTSEYE